MYKGFREYIFLKRRVCIKQFPEIRVSEELLNVCRRGVQWDTKSFAIEDLTKFCGFLKP